MDRQIPRRRFLASATAAAGACTAASPRASAAPQPKPGDFPVKAISSANGQPATRRAYQELLQGSDTLDAAIAGVGLVESDPNDTSVGYGGLPNEQGVVELDAAVMHGPSHRAGAVAALQDIKHPAQVARQVLYRSDHVLMVGHGALQFAKAHGFRQENLLTEKARKIWLYWKENLSGRDDWLPPPQQDVDPEVSAFFGLDKHAVANTQDTGIKRRKWSRPTGTIHCAAMNRQGDISCTTTTSGLAFKIPGRVGDSPIIGAGLYVDNQIGSCGSTGRGEANLQNQCCFAAVELMRQGKSPQEAGLEVLRRVAAHTSEPQLKDTKGRPNFNLKFYLLAKDGRHAGASMYGPTKFAVTDAQGTRLEACKHLYERG